MKKILIVDSSAASRATTEIILSTSFETFCAATGEQAVEIFRTQNPDAVLSQVWLADMMGVELLKKFRATFGEKIPFVFTGDDSDEVKTLDNGAADFIREPFAPEILICRLEKILT